MTPAGIMFDAWCAEVGVGRKTAFRWRQTIIGGEPMLVVAGSINGRLFITAAEDERFWARARAGEFARELAGAARASEIAPEGKLVKLTEEAT